MSGHSQFSLLGQRRFLPLFIAVLIGAFNDNAFRLSLTTLYSSPEAAAYVPLSDSSADAVLGALFVLPFFLFSALAGQWADKFDKALVARRIKLIEIGLIALASYSLFSQSFLLQMACVFLAGTQAAFFGPIKYAILPQYLHKSELLGGNGMVESGTSLAILAGMLFGNYFIAGGSGRTFVSASMIGLALLGYLAAWQMPKAPSIEPDLRVNPNLAGESWDMVKMAMEKRDVWLSVLGISWFWFLGIVFLSQIVPFTKDILHASPSCSTLILAVFSVATGLGSMACNRVLSGKITLKYVPLSALLLSLFVFDLYFAAGAVGREFSADAPASPGELLASVEGLRVLFDLSGTAFMSGLFVVPLFALMQARTPYYRRARIVGANNIVNAVFMVGASLISLMLLKLVSVRGLYLLLGLANLGVVIWLAIEMPQTLLAACARLLFRLLYRVEVKGMEHYHAAGKRVLIVPNHTSFLDGPMLSCFLPERTAFAINTFMAKAWWVKPAFSLFDLCPIDPLNPLSVRELVRRLERNQKVVIFPEGRITTTGGLMKIYEGPAAIANMADAKVLPLRIDGAIYSPFSRMRGKLKLRWFPKITLTFLEPVKLSEVEGASGAALRQAQAEKLYDVMSRMMFETSGYNKTLWPSLLNAAHTHGKKRRLLEDQNRAPLTYGRMIMGSIVLGRKLAELTPGQKTVAVLLPNVNGAALTFFGLLSQGKVPAMLNFSTGAINMTAACVAAEVRSIVTSRRFIEQAEMEEAIATLSRTAKVIYLEDVRASLGLAGKITGLLAKVFPRALSRRAATDPHEPAVILFTSGSEGLPKGVVLSHRNLNSNWHQVAARLAFTPDDLIFCALPVFHAFGVIGGLVLPALSGVKVFLYPSPLHYKIVPEMVYDSGATALIGTDTFLMGYAKNAHPYDFFNLRLVVAGAERVKPETRAVWMEKFGHRILEGYGATECSPAIALNTQMHFKLGTVGQIVDGMEYRLEPVPGIAEGGRLIVKGPNVMLGYLRADAPGVIEPPPGGWYDTGDICSVDEQRYITILGRAKRFAKIAGEMVSLTAVESKLQAIYPQEASAVVAVPDKRKGEQLVLFTANPKMERKAMADGMKAQGATELMIPKVIVHLEHLPVLGSGKIDYVTLGRMALEKVEA